MATAWPKADFTPTPTERRACGLRLEQTQLEFAQSNLYITEGPLVGDGGTPVPWSPDTFPLQRSIVEAIDDPRWSKVVLMASPQSFGKTQCAALTTILYAIEYRGVSALYVAAKESLAVTQWRKKIEKAIKANKRLARLIYENPDFGGTKERRDFTNGTSLHLAGAESVGSLAAFTCPVIICDDVQAYPASLPGYGHPADLAYTRSEAYPPDAITHVLVGTAGNEGDYLWRAMKDSALFCPFVPCPHCGIHQLLEWSRLEFDREDPEEALKSTTFRCASCGESIAHEQLPGMLREHRWISCPPKANWITTPTAGGVIVEDLAAARIYPETARKTSVAGFWCNALYWPFRPWSHRAAESIERRGNPDREKDFQQQFLVIPWKDPEVDEERLTEEELATHVVDGYAAGTVPEGADLVTGTVDVQSGYVYYHFRAWKKVDGTSWLVNLGTVGKPIKGERPENRKVKRTLGIARGLDEVDAIATRGWDKVDVKRKVVGHLTAVMILVDRGYEGDVVAGWWFTKHRGIWSMIRGQKAGRSGTLWPRKPSLDKRGRPYRHVDVNQAKQTIRRLLRIPAGEPGYWHMPSEGLHSNTVRAYYRHMASERFNRDRKTPCWELITPGTANHFWDCETYQVIAAVACGVHLRGGLLVEERRVMTDWFKKQREARAR